MKAGVFEEERRMADERNLVGQDDRIPADNLQRGLVMARPNTDPNLPHLGVAGDTYTILLAGKDTAGQFCLIDMYIPPGGGPPAHRHDFEETFSSVSYTHLTLPTTPYV